MGPLRAALGFMMVVVFAGCVSTPSLPETTVSAQVSAPLSPRSLPGLHKAAMLGIGAVAAMSAASAGAALRPASAEHVLWNASSANFRSRPRRAETGGPGTDKTSDCIAAD